MKRRRIGHHMLATALTVALAASAVALEPAGSPKQFVADLAGDGSMMKVIVRKTGKKDVGTFYQLVVSNDEGTVIWEGPKTLNPEDKLVFGEWDYGISMPEVVGDIDGDGVCELVAPAPRGDVSPTTFRVLRWTGNAFKPLRAATLMETPPGSGKYTWGKTDAYLGRWIDNFQSVAPIGDELTVAVTEYKDGAEQVKSGKAVVVRQPDGFKLKRWIEPLRPPTSDSEPPATDNTPAPKDTPRPTSGGTPGKPLVQYMCQIGDEDLRNSSGVQLTEVAAILQQDRANYHKNNIRHRRDMPGDTFFTSATNRQLFDSLPVECPGNLAAAIRQGGVTVTVTVYPDRIVVSQPQ